MKTLLMALCLLTLGLNSLNGQTDTMEARAQEKKARPWFAQFMSNDPVVAGA